MTKKTRFGDLLDKYNGGGVRREAITDKELLELHAEMEYFIDMMDDTENKHSAMWGIMQRSAIEHTLYARNLQFGRDVRRKQNAKMA